MLTFVCGGVRSGKSNWGEKAAEKLRRADGKLIYLATAQPSDEEMKNRILLHQRERQAKCAEWTTIEQSVKLDACADFLRNHDILFLDCLTTWLSNEMFIDFNRQLQPKDIKRRIIAAVAALERACNHVIIISNDLFHEPIPHDKHVYRYIRVLGELHQYFVHHAKTAVKMEAGRPVVMKGEVLR
ncbi:bifunctional adenosylcobinamide kinase/adenosylcobinamide-phosphate guanylyltransferase [Alteribacillus bidgolensis]|uniref:Adenosylcobinamide kinase n=1 Tax=Alteribacillus bidgolensis TaxID=930129 RepID=A0A1G8C033_9BACI|nr:bifunctional adenosylcobinamide kinase/adenosylcobinamide-phosphate guanylyltransferase [Alteribacillus bidgolensis]SDH38806.1 adenosylcobinamide kinase /adenosylcobinamide-phosphate guanylyltransferase [Alteribacillus bidgolensis]